MLCILQKRHWLWFRDLFVSQSGVHNRLVSNTVIQKASSCYLVFRLILGSRCGHQVVGTVNFRSGMLTVAVSAVSGMERSSAVHLLQCNNITEYFVETAK